MNRSTLLAALLLAPLLLLPARVGAQDAQEDGASESRDEEAHALFMAGRTAYQAGRYEEALRHFQASYEASGRPELLYNVGQSADRLRRDRIALDAFEAFLEQAEEPENRAQVEARIVALRRSLGARPEGSSPTGEPASGGGISPVGPILLGVGGALLIGAAITGGLALSLRSDWQSQCTGMSCPASAETTAEEMEGLALGTDILWATGAAVAVTGLVLTLLLTEGGEEEAPTATAACGPGGCSLFVEGSF